MNFSATVATQRARGGLIAGLLLFAVGSWVYLALVASRMDDVSSMLAMPMTSAWSPTQGALMALMWGVMMAAMMLPSAIPMVIMYDRMDRAAEIRSGSTGMFVAGYIAIWLVFAIAATGLQWMLHSISLVNGMGVVTQVWFAGSLLVVTGIYQFTPLKRRSLGACRTPMGFLMTSWREGKVGALAMGIDHGRHCIGCCWSLMVLLFVLGVMNLAWVAVLSAFVLIEKLAPNSEVIASVGGVLMLAWGVAMIF